MSKEQLLRQAYEIQEARRNLRQKERNMAAQNKYLSSTAAVSNNGDGLRAAIEKFLPKTLVPRNVGNLKEVTWPFWYPLEFDFGTDPTYNINTRQTKTVQVSQESAFLLTSISRGHVEQSAASQDAPLQLTIRDNQSTRQFNDLPIPMQMIGTQGELTELDFPLYFRPNATISIEMTSWVPTDFATTGDGRTQIMLHGFRIRNTDVSKVLSNIFI
jgi:hypothetical protein